MKFTAGNAISLTPASPGSAVKIDGVADQTFPVVAWAIVCTYVDGDGADTAIQPVFLVDGETYTTSDWYRTAGTESGVKVVTA